jgi:polysaccharide export outer membrane protein
MKPTSYSGRAPSHRIPAWQRTLRIGTTPIGPTTCGTCLLLLLLLPLLGAAESFLNAQPPVPGAGQPSGWSELFHADRTLERSASDAASASSSNPVRLCQTLEPFRQGLDCPPGGCRREPGWNDAHPIPWEIFGQGEYIGPVRMPQVPQYRIRVDDQLDFVYRLTRVELGSPYALNVGDEIRVESLTDEKIDRNLLVQPDGSITLRLLGQVPAARRTVADLTRDLEQRYQKYYKVPAITVTPIRVNTRLEDLRSSIDSRYGRGGQSFATRVSPDGTIQLPGLGSVPAIGLSLDELKREVDERYGQIVRGIEVTPVLIERAPRHIFVVGEVVNSGRFPLVGPTSVMQALALAGGWTNGGDLRHVVVFRRAEDWRLLATRLDIQGAWNGKRPCPADEIWLRDSDVVVVPRTGVMRATDAIDLLFTRGLYRVVPLQGSVNFTGASRL